MTTSILARTSALVLPLCLAASCASTINPPPSQPGDWHFEGGSSGFYTSTDGGDFGDTNVLSVQVSGGCFVTDQVLVEGIVGASDSKFEDDAGDEIKTSTMQLGIGARFYPNPDGASRPYIAARTGFDHVDINDDFTGTDEGDTSPFVEARLGLEAFVSSGASVDMGVSWQEIFSRDIGSTEDNLNTYGVFVGFSVWL